MSVRYPQWRLTSRPHLLRHYVKLTPQSTASVEAHIEALARDRMLVISNIRSSGDQAVRIGAELADVEDRLRDAERSLATVNQAVGAVREQLAKAASDLTAVEREGDKVAAIGQELRDLQIRIDAWLDEARSVSIAPVHEFDLERRVNEFTAQLRRFLRALGHGELLAQPANLRFASATVTQVLPGDGEANVWPASMNELFREIWSRRPDLNG